jgi:hypothetical protein
MLNSIGETTWDVGQCEVNVGGKLGFFLSWGRQWESAKVIMWCWGQIGGMLGSIKDMAKGVK